MGGWKGRVVPTAEQLLAQGVPGAAGDEPEIIGGFAGPASPIGRRVAMTGPAGAVPVQTQLEAQRRVYTEGDDRVPAGLPVELVVQLQRGMARAGVLSGQFRIGVWDDKSRNAYRQVLAFANQQGTSDLEALNQLASAPKVGGPQAFTPGKFLPPDPAVYREQLRSVFVDALDRDPDDDELRDLTRLMRRSQRGAFNAAAEGFEDGGGTATQFNAAYERESENAAARFQEALANRFAGEVKFKEAQADNAAQGGLLGGILGTIDEVA